MGKDFERELQNLDLIYQGALAGDIGVLTGFLQKYIHLPFLSVGSGGSLSVAHIFEYLCAKSGGIAKSLTPMELTLFTKQMQEMAVLLFTAGGRNKDSIHAYQYLSELEPEGLLTCCMCANAPIKELQRNNLHNDYFEYRMPIPKDGYLAVESLVSSMVLLCRAFEGLTGSSFFRLPSTVSWGTHKPWTEQVRSILAKETLIVLHGGITTPAAIDLESKFSEVSLGNIQLVDFRNFAHGRHYWLSDRRDRTAIVSMAGTSMETIADKTLGLLPQDIPVIRFDVEDKTVDGLFSSFDFVFQLVLQAGLLRGINPGKPKVADFGKKLYHLSYNICNQDELKNRRKDPVAMAVYRKYRGIRCCDEEAYRKAGLAYLRRLVGKIFKGVIFDYDGTLYDKHGEEAGGIAVFEQLNQLLSRGIKIGIATGRGKSVRSELKKVISKNFWQEVVIAYYNGGCIGLLGDDRQPDKEATPVPKAFDEVKRRIDLVPELSLLEIDGITDKNPFQWTIFMDTYQSASQMKRLLSLCGGVPGVKAVQSSHSVDIIPETSSKVNIFAYWSGLGYTRDDFIVMGDAGQFGGNDYELLNCPYALSVDRVSEQMDVCWNFAKPGMRNLEATLYYLEHFEPREWGEFCLDLKG